MAIAITEGKSYVEMDLPLLKNDMVRPTLSSSFLIVNCYLFNANIIEI